MKVRLVFLGLADERRNVTYAATSYEPGQVFEADSGEDGARVVMGKTGDCDIRIQHATIGRRAASISVRQGELWVEDYGSGGGTFILRGDSIIDRPRCALVDGDALGIGVLLFKVELVR